MTHTAQTSCNGEDVIIIHGLAMSPIWMIMAEKRLRKAGYRVHNFGYPSMKKTVEELVADHLDPFIKNLPADLTKLHFLVHSMGGILTRHYLKNYDCPHLGRVVMLGTPNHGSEVVDYMKDWWLFKKIMGPAAQQLTTDESSLPNSLGPVAFECGVIAGTCHWQHFATGPFMPKPSDGLVSLASTMVEGMKDHLSMHIEHSFMASHKKVALQAMHFYEHGTFHRPIAGRESD